MDRTDNTPFGNFEVICKNCGSKNIELDNSLGFSETSGAWGSIDLYCVDCGNRIELTSGY